MLIIGERIKMLRESHNLSQAALAKRLGITVERKCVGIGPECTEYTVYYRIIRDF